MDVFLSLFKYYFKSIFYKTYDLKNVKLLIVKASKITKISSLENAL